MSITKYHARWLSLIEISGPFLSLPVLSRVFPQGLDAHDPDHFRLLRQVHEEWEDNQIGPKPDPAIHTQWISWVLSNTLEYDEAIVEGQQIPPTLKAEIEEPQHRETLRPDMVLMGPDNKAQLLIHVYPRQQKLSKPVSNRAWKASPDTRMTQLLRDTGIPLGLITNGEHWMFVYAPVNDTSGYASWYATLWLEEQETLAAFRTLLGMHRFFGVAESEMLPPLLKESAAQQQEVTDRLGYQVRSAVEILIQSLDRADQDYGRELLQNVPESVLYEASLTVMMRLVILFCAEERELLLLGDPLYDQHYAVSTLVAQLQEAADEHGEEILERRLDAWNRLLSTFRAVYGGVSHDRMRLPAYGGGLFDPDKFPFLEGRMPKTKWLDTPAISLPVNNRTVLHLLRSMQYLELHGEAQRLSFRALDIEQIGHVYEGLLDHTAKRAIEPVLGLIGKKEPEVALAEMEKQREKGDESFFKYLKEQTGSTRRWANAIDQELNHDDANRLRAVCGNDEALFARVQPFASLVRIDTFGRPVVVRKGSVFVTAGTDRRSSGTHYTPKTLTEPIVQYTLEPLVYEGPAEGKERTEWKLKSAKELLELKICDMACGSGAFLVQAARYMAERLEEAWEQSGDARVPTRETEDARVTQGVQPAAAISKRDQSQPDSIGPQIVAEHASSYPITAKRSLASTLRTTPSGSPSLGKPEEQLIPSDPSERRTYAMRIVAQRCLYGVDVNPLAVEMAKLSLWLLTLAKDKPFEFLDHAIRCGDSLVGIHDIKQLKHFSLKPENIDQPLFSGPWLDGVEEAISLRLKLEDMSANTVEDVAAQEQLLAQAEDKIARLRCAADLLVAAEFWGENNADKQERTRHFANVSGHYITRGPTEEFQEKATKECKGQRTFHWPLEYPEVIVKRSGFDAFIGNPPFVGGRRIRSSLGIQYLGWLTDSVFGNSSGNADICAFFFLRASSLLNDLGGFGLLATNTIAEGDTRQVGLDRIAASGRVIARAKQSEKWPGIATVEVAHVWIHSGDWKAPRVLDGNVVANITTMLTLGATCEELPPKRLASNQNISFQGCVLVGKGFMLNDDEAQRLLSIDKSYHEVVKPYLNGMALNSHPKQAPDRYAITFFDMPLTKKNGDNSKVAADFPAALKIVQERVKPERQRTKLDKAGKEVYVLRKPLPQKWWIYGDKRPAMYDAIKDLQRVLVRSRVSNINSMAFVPIDMIFSDAVVVFATECHGFFATVQSTLHTVWLEKYASSLRTDIRYTPTDCFETFPLPADIGQISDVGARYDQRRQAVLKGKQIGLTQMYNQFHDLENNTKEISDLRHRHVEMDRSVAIAYGWGDLDLGHGFHETKQVVRFTICESARREVLQRLLKLNHERYAEEVKQGLHDKKKSGRKRAASGEKKPRKASAKKQSATMSFLDDEEG